LLLTLFVFILKKWGGHTAPIAREKEKYRKPGYTGLSS
jgi:hypothetical protein